jgi:hypothetical protein
MKNSAGILAVLCLMGFLSFSHAEAASVGSFAADSSAPVAIGKLNPPGLSNDVAGHAPSAPPGSSTPSNVFRDIPSISGGYSVGGTTLKPYLGAGFGSGYASELDRSLNHSPSPQTDSGVRSLFGQGLTPNEFQMGIRIPF